MSAQPDPPEDAESSPDSDEAAAVAATASLTALPTAAAGSGSPPPLSRDAALAVMREPIHLAEEVIHVPRVGALLVSEISSLVWAEIQSAAGASMRAMIVAAQVPDAAPPASGKADMVQYNTKLIYHGLVDPASPEGARTPLLRENEVESFMRKFSHSTVNTITDAIERLSLLGKYAPRAEGNSAAAPSDAQSSD